MCFGISIATEFFQRTIEETLRGIEGVIFLIIDILIQVHGTSIKEHDKRLQEVFRKLVDIGITLNTNKCVIRTTKI